MKKLTTAIFFAVLAAAAAMADALDTTLFAKKSVLTISGYSGSTTLANFPVLVRLAADSPAGFDYADVTNGDIRFADANGNSLPFEIEKWDSSGESHVWVSVPSLSGQATTITMYYGAITGKLPPVDSTGVWSLAGYQNVHHFSDASGYMDIESSANNLTVTRQGANAVDAAGVLGSSLATGDGSMKGLKVETDSSWMWGAGGTVTFSAWGKCGVDGTSRYLFGTTGAYGEANVSTLTFRANVGGTTVEGAIPSASGWHLYTVVFDGSDLSLFINGTLAESKSCSIAAASAALYWGSNGSNRWKGSIDEARLRNVADTPDWIQACCDTMTNANFVAAAPVEANATTAPTFANGTTGTPLDATKFASRIPLTISGYDGSDAIENLPVLIRLGSISAQGFDISTLASDGSNFRFADALGNNLPFEIDTWDATSGKNAWVTVPYVEGTGTTIYLYFDTSATLAANSPSSVWTSAGYKNVMHYQSTMDAAGCHDSTGINTGITTVSTTIGTAKGKVGDGADSSNSSSKGFRFTLGDAAWSKGDPITFSTWAYTTDGSRPVFGDHNGTSLYCIHVNAEKLFVCNRPLATGPAVAADVEGTKTLALANDSNAKWCYFTFVCDGAVTKVYANGVYEGMVATPLPVMSAFAWGYANDGRYKGYCDESRIHAVAETADFVAASYKTMTDASFVVAGDVEPAVTSYTPQILSAEPTLNSIEVKMRLTAFEAGASSVSLTLLYGTSADALTSELSLGSITAPGSLTRTLSGLGFSTTYYLQVKAVDNFDNEARSEVVEVATGADIRMDTSPFAYKSAATVGGYAGSTTLANFPVLVRLAANSPVGFNYEDCAADGSDIRFTDVDGIPIPHEIDTWDRTGTSLIWVQIPKLSGTATELTMYYGAANPSALPAVDPHAVWTAAGHRAVWHFAADETESAQGLTAEKTGTPSYANDGAVGKCWYSEGTAWLKYANDASWSALGEGSTVTISVWAKHEGGYDYNRILSTMSAWTEKAGYELTVQNNKNQITVGSSGQSQYQKVVSPGPMDEMVYLTAVFNADRHADLYVNGVLQEHKQLNAVVQPTEPMTVACVGNGGNVWNGSLDELRLHAAAESADWVKACYDTMASASFVTMYGVTAVGGVQPLVIRSNGATLSGTTATITGRLANLGTGATSADVTLYYGTSANVEGGTAVGPASYNDKADLSNTLLGLTPAATYYYAYKAVNNAETPETAWTATNSFVVEASTRFSDTLDIAVRNCQMAVTGMMTDWGVGTTVVELLVGTSADNLVSVQTVNLSAAPANMEVAFDPLTEPIGTYYVAIRATTTYNGIVWVRETATSSVTLADTATYTWKGGKGDWADPAMWTSSDTGAGGYPTDGCTVVIPAADSDIVLSANLTLAGLTISSEGKHVFCTADASKNYKLTVSNNNAKLAGAGGGTLVVDNIVIDSKVTDLAGLKQLAIAGSGRVFPANSETTEILLVNGGCVYAGWENKTFGKLILQGGPGRIESGNYTFSFASLETRRGSGVSAAYLTSGKVSFRDPSGVEMVGGTDTLDNPGPQIPVCTQFLIASGNNDQRYGKSLCTIDAQGVVREIPQSSMLTSFDGATAFDNVYIASDTMLDADVTVNAVLFSGASCNLGGHTVTVKSGQFREGSGGLWNKVISNGVVRLCKPNVVADSTNNADVRMRVDFATDGVSDMLTPMVSHDAVNTGWAYMSKYDGFTGVFSTPRGKDYYLQSSFSASKAVLELRASKLTAQSHGNKANFGGMAGDGEINFNYNGQNRWNNNIWLGEMSEDDAELVSAGTVNASVMVGNKGVFAPGLVGYDGGRRGSIRMTWDAQGDIPMLRAFLMQPGGMFLASLNADGTCGYLDATKTNVSGKYLSVTLDGTLSVTTAGRVANGVPYPIIKYHEGQLSGRFANVTQGFKVRYDVLQADGSYAVTVEKKSVGTVIRVR